MIGYLLCDPSRILDSFKSPEYWPLKLWKNVLVEDYNDCRLLLFKNENINNYLVNDKDLLVLIAGTIIYRGKRGVGAAKKIAEDVRIGVRLERIYDESFGPFNLLIGDKKQGQLVLLTDREGMQGAFLHSHNSKFIISSNLLMLAAILGCGPDPVGAGEYLHLGHSLEWRTIFDGIERIRGGTKLWTEAGSWKAKRIWRIQVSYPYSPDDDFKIIEKVSGLISDSVADAITTLPKAVGVDLTGGTDSRTVLSVLLNNKGWVEATTAGPQTHIDVVIASKISKKLNLPFYWFEDRPINCINYDQISSAIETANGVLSVLTVLKSMDYYAEKSKRYDLMMGGCGGPLFKDHYWLYEFNRIDKMKEPNWDRIASLSTTDSPIDDALTPGFKNGIRQHIKEIFFNHSQEISGVNNQKLDYVYFDLKCPNVIGPQFGLTNQYLDLYHPLIDGRIVEYVINSRPFIRKWNNLEFSIIFNSNNELAWVPTDNGIPAVPSIGRYLYLRSYIAFRYIKAAVRKLKMYGLRAHATESPHPIGDLINIVQAKGFDNILDFNKMHLSIIVNKQAFRKLKEKSVPSGYQNYLSNAMSEELFYRKCEEMRKEMLC